MRRRLLGRAMGTIVTQQITDLSLYQTTASPPIAGRRYGWSATRYLGRAALLCSVMVLLPSCALNTPLKRFFPDKAVTEVARPDAGKTKKGHIVNSTQTATLDDATAQRRAAGDTAAAGTDKPFTGPAESGLPIALFAPKPPYRPVPKTDRRFIENSPFETAPPARDIPPDAPYAVSPGGFPFAMSAAKPPLRGFSPVPEIISANPPVAQSNLRTAIKLAPITITDPGPGPKTAPNRANALVHVDPAITKPGHFRRPARAFQTLAQKTAEPLPITRETFRWALAASYKDDPSLEAERLRVKEVDENYIQARAQSRPQISANANLAETALRRPSGPDGLSTEWGNPRDATVTITQPIYQGGRLKALKRQAKAGIMAARERLRNAEQTTTLSSATAYADVIRDEEIAKIRRDTLRILARQQQAAEDRYDVGEGTTTDIFQAQARLADAEIGLAQAEGQLASSRARYTRLIGHSPTVLEAIPALNVPKTVDDAVEIARVNNPQLRALTRDFDASFEAIKIAEAAGKPSLALSGSAGAERGQLFGLSRREDASLALQLRVPLYAGGGNQSRERQAALTRDRLYYEVIETERAVDEAVRQLWANRAASVISLAEARAQEAATRAAFDGVKDEQLFGQRDLLDVLNAENEWQNARAQVVTARRNIQIATFRLLNVMGVFDARHLSLPVALYDPAQNLNQIAQSRFSFKEPKVIITENSGPNPPVELPVAPPF